MSPTSDTQGRAGYLELARGNADFRNLWYGQIVSLFGDWFNLIASASLVGKLTGSGLAVGSLFAVRMLAPFLISPVAGVAADRYNRKKLLILTDIIRAIVVLGFLFVRSPQQVWLLYALTAVQLAMTGVFFPTRNAILPEVVSRRELGTANALTSTTWSVMLAFGAAMGGLVAGGWGIYPAFVIDALTFLLSAVFIARVRYRPQGSSEERKGSLRDAVRRYVDGLSYLKRHPDILAIALHKAALCLFVAGAYDVIQVAVSTQIFVIGEGGGISLGILYAVVGVGSGIGPILARHFTGDRDRALRIALLVAYLMMATGLVVASTLANFGILLLGTFIRALGGGMLWVFSTQLLLHLVPNEVRGRVFSTEFALMTLAMATSAASSGWILDQTSLGIAGLLRTMTGIALIPGLLWGLWLVFSNRSEPPIQSS
jgi:MFS family permease